MELTTIAAPVTNDMTTRIIYTMVVMAKWSAYMVSIKGAILNSEFENGETLKNIRGLEK